MEPHRRYRVRVCIRRGPGFIIRPDVDVDRIDGRLMIVNVMWRITAEESETYAGEYALSAPELEDASLTWIASGDVEVIEEIEEMGR